MTTNKKRLRKELSKEGKRILILLESRRDSFERRKRFDRAQPLNELIKLIKRRKIKDYSYLENCGLELEMEKTEFIFTTMN